MVAGVAALVLGLLCVGVWAAVKGRVRDQLCDRARYCDGEHYYCRRACAEWNGMVMINFILLAVLFTPLHLIFVGAYARGFFGYHAQAPGARLPRLCAWAAREPLAALVHAVAYACCLVALFALLRPMLATYGNPTWNHVVLYTSSGGGSKVEKVVVQGAGGPNFNTIYYPVGNADGVPMYGGEKGGGTSTLRREGGMWVAKGHAGVTRYQCKSDAAQPPETGWESLGWGSAPTLQVVLLKGGAAGGGGAAARGAGATSFAEEPGAASGRLQEALDGAPRLKLVAAGSADALPFDNAATLRSGGTAPLTANGKNVSPFWSQPRNAWGHWDYIDLGVTDRAQPLHVNLDGPYVVWNGQHGEMVFDVAMWKLHEGTHLVAVKACAGNPGGPTRLSKDACGRDFVLHADGTIGPRTAQHLRLGAAGGAGGGAGLRMAGVAYSLSGLATGAPTAAHLAYHAAPLVAAEVATAAAGGNAAVAAVASGACSIQ